MISGHVANRESFQLESTSQNGFTLIELLATVAIVSILLALCVGGLQKARTSAEKSACMSNLRQIGTGLLSFASEHDGQLPESGSTIRHGQTDPQTGLPGWTEQIEPYMGGVGLAVYRCTSSARLYPSNAIYSYFQGSHAASVALPLDAVTRFAAVRLSLISNPSITIMGGDIASGAFDKDDTDKDDYTQSPAFPNTPITIHGGASNILFYDGHVAACKAFDNQTMAVQYGGPTDQDTVYK